MSLRRDTSQSKKSIIQIDRIAFGVRYEPQWRIMDYMGSLIDEIIRAPGSPFGPSKFTHSTRTTEAQVLFNEKTNERLQLNATDTILELDVNTFDLEKVLQIASEFENRVLGLLKDVVRLNNIIRYGMLFKLAESSKELSPSPIEHYLSSEFENARTMDMKFTTRLPSFEGVGKQGVNDFRNLIYRIIQNDDSKVYITVDYQEYFDPLLNREEWDKRKFVKFAQYGVNYFETGFTKWLSKLMNKEIAA